MHQQVKPRLAKWPFFIGDAVLLLMACWIYGHGKWPMGASEIFLYVVAVALGALLGVTPFLLEYWAAVRLAEAADFATTATQLQNLDRIASHINGATAQWQQVQAESVKTICATKEIADRMTAEARSFTDFIQQANTGEKATLRLEIEKMRRAENDWLQVVMRMLDHVYALHNAALHSGQRGLIDQLGHFQHACHDVCRRIGLVPFLAVAGQPFDPTSHRLVDEHTNVPAEARVSETIATGYTYQGQRIRLALVSLQQTDLPDPPANRTASAATTRKQLREIQSTDGAGHSSDPDRLTSPATQPPLL